LVDFIAAIAFVVLGIMILRENNSCDHLTLVDFMSFSVVFKTFTILMLLVPLFCLYLDQLPPQGMVKVYSIFNIPFDINECAICLQTFDLEKNQLLKLKCQHVFDEKCISEWIQSHLNCPGCRAELKEVHYFNMFLNSY